MTSLGCGCGAAVRARTGLPQRHHAPPGAVGLLTVISKGCSSDCVEDAENYYVGKKNVTCCSTNLCNRSGAPGLQPATALGLLAALGSLLLWGPSQL